MCVTIKTEIISFIKVYHQIDFICFIRFLIEVIRQWPSMSPLVLDRWKVIVYSPGADTRVCREPLLLPPSSLCCVFAGPACQTLTGFTNDKEKCQNHYEVKVYVQMYVFLVLQHVALTCSSCFTYSGFQSCSIKMLLTLFKPWRGHSCFYNLSLGLLRFLVRGYGPVWIACSLCRT